MSIRTLEELSDYLDEELAWRRKELADLKGLVDNASSAGRRRDALLRCGVAILYAHWEGFIKSAAGAYLEYVSRQRLRYDELTANFVAAGIKSLLSRAIQSNRPRDHNELVAFFLTRMSERSAIPYKKAIDTESNLLSTVFRDIVEKLGLDFSVYEAEDKLIDERLVKTRNTIAHGSYLTIDARSFDDLLTEVVDIMVLFRNQIDNSAQARAFHIAP
jgi:hypothetical protein